jgi:hypothetical protein
MGNIVSWKEHVSRTRSSWEDEIEIKAKPRWVYRPDSTCSGCVLLMWPRSWSFEFSKMLGALGRSSPLFRTTVLFLFQEEL